MQSEARSGTAGVVENGPPVRTRTIIGAAMAVVATVLAAIAVVLPWGIRNKYSSLLRWFRNFLMQNVRVVRRWALRKRWEWDGDEN